MGLMPLDRGYGTACLTLMGPSRSSENSLFV
jgi:hypothetical protein